MVFLKEFLKKADFEKIGNKKSNWIFFLCFYCRLLTFDHLFFKFNFFQKILSKLSECQNSLFSAQDQHLVCPDLGPNCLQRLSADDKKSQLARKEFTASKFVWFDALCPSQQLWSCGDGCKVRFQPHCHNMIAH